MLMLMPLLPLLALLLVLQLWLLLLLLTPRAPPLPSFSSHLQVVSFSLARGVLSAKAKVAVMSTKIEVTLPKAAAGEQWAAFVDSSAAGGKGGGAPAYPSSSKVHI